MFTCFKPFCSSYQLYRDYCEFIPYHGEYNCVLMCLKIMNCSNDFFTLTIHVFYDWIYNQESRDVVPSKGKIKFVLQYSITVCCFKLGLPTMLIFRILSPTTEYVLDWNTSYHSDCMYLCDSFTINADHRQGIGIDKNVSVLFCYEQALAYAGKVCSSVYLLKPLICITLLILLDYVLFLM